RLAVRPNLELQGFPLSAGIETYDGAQSDMGDHIRTAIFREMETGGPCLFIVAEDSIVTFRRFGLGIKWNPPEMYRSPGKDWDRGGCMPRMSHTVPQDKIPTWP